MKILFVSAWFPWPPNNGSRIRVYNLIKALSKRHDVYLVSLLHDDSDPADAAKLEPICQVLSLHPSRWFKPGTLKSALGFFSSRPRSVVDTFDPTVRDAVSTSIEKINPDMIVASTLGVAEYVPRNLDIPMLLEQHNCEFAILKRNAAKIANPIKRFRYDLAWRKFAGWEADICGRYDAITMVSELDREQMLTLAPGLKRVEVVPNGVDIDQYNPSSRDPQPDTLIYNGALTYRANFDAVYNYVQEIYPEFVKLHPNAMLHVTGRTDGVDINAIAACPGVELTGYVQDMRLILNRAALCVVPLREGGGSRLKILEAMASGVPVVSTSVGVEGIAAEDGVHILLADKPSDFAAAIDRVLSDSDLASSLASQARELVERQYSWASLGETFVEIVESIAVHGEFEATR